jgi:hypothetical protein
MEEAELGGLVNLEELWLGKNKIEKIEGLSKVSVVTCCSFRLYFLFAQVLIYVLLRISSFQPAHKVA